MNPLSSAQVEQGLGAMSHISRDIVSNPGVYCRVDIAQGHKVFQAVEDCDVRIWVALRAPPCTAVEGLLEGKEAHARRAPEP